MPCAGAQAARSIARSGQQGQVKVLGRAAFAPLYHQDNPLDGLSRAEKVDLLKRIDVATRALDPRIKQVTVSPQAYGNIFSSLPWTADWRRISARWFASTSV